MAGRAGRRGLDTTGTVIILANNCERSAMPTDIQLRNMILGNPTTLSSRFKITYSMILYLHRGELQSPQELIRQSFMHANDLKHELARKRKVELLKELLKNSLVGGEGDRIQPRLSKTGPVVGLAGPSSASSSAENSPDYALETKCPAHPLDSEEACKCTCIEQMPAFYKVKLCLEIMNCTSYLMNVLDIEPYRPNMIGHRSFFDLLCEVIRFRSF